MKKSESYYLLPGTCIGKAGLPGGKLECKKGAKAPLKVEPKYYDICGEVFDYLIAQGKMVDGPGLKKMEEAEAAEAAKAKSDAKKAKDKETKEAQAAAKAEAEAAEKLEALKKQAAELGIEAEESATVEELETMIDAELNK